MMNVTARGGHAIVSPPPRYPSVNPWIWTPVRDCSEKLIAVLNSNNSPYLTFKQEPYAPSGWKGFYTLDSIRFDNWKYDLQLEFGMGDEKSIMLTFDGFCPPDSKAPVIIPVAIATKKAMSELLKKSS